MAAGWAEYSYPEVLLAGRREFQVGVDARGPLAPWGWKQYVE